MRAFRKIVFWAGCFFSTLCFAGSLWHCTAMNDAGAVWNHYGLSRETTQSTVEKDCRHYSNDESCRLLCFPPRTYWRCLSHDTLPNVTVSKDSKNNGVPKPGTWYWTSFSKQIAINGARDACRHNSAYGGCYADPKACASS